MRTLKSGSTHKESRGLGNDVSESLQWPSSAKQSYRVRIDDVTWYVERALAASCCDATSLSRSNWCVHMFLGRPDQSGWSYKHLAAEQMNADGEECAGGRRRVRRQPKEGAQAKKARATEGECAVQRAHTRRAFRTTRIGISRKGSTRTQSSSCAANVCGDGSVGRHG